MTMSASVTKISAVAIVPMAAAVARAISFSLWQISSHCFLPPTAATTTPNTIVFPLSIILRYGQVQW